MLQNAYTISDLIDLALIIPEVGAVNFNILHTVLHTIVTELKITDVRPMCHIENPLLAKTALMKTKLRQAAQRRETLIPDSVGIIFTGRPETNENISESKEDTSRFSAKKDISVELPRSLHAEPSSTEHQLTPPTVTEGLVQTAETSVGAEDDSGLLQAPLLEVEKKPESPRATEVSVQTEQPEIEIKKDETKPAKRQHMAEDEWKYRHLTKRVEAMEDGLQDVSNIVDAMVNKLMKAEKRKKEGGPASEELESIDERILEVEETLAKFEADHGLLMDIDSTLNNTLKEFEEIKALASLLEQMQLDISKKADKEETEAALALKGDLELVNTKVDQLEFETAIEELGEAIGLLGLKFTRKNDEWEERAAEIWRGIDSKMTRDIFEAAKVKIESRLTALMYGLRKLKKVVEELLYPESSGVTRCILCRRPACISGLECLEMSASPKRPLSEKSSGDEDSERLKETINDAFKKKQKMDLPPYSKTRDTIISIPYSSSSYHSSLDDKQESEMPYIKLMPVTAVKESTISKKTSQIPKLPEINDVESVPRPTSKRPVNRRGRTEPQAQKIDLVFTKKMLAIVERSSTEISPQEKFRYTAVLEGEPQRETSVKQSSLGSSVNIDLTPEPEKTLNDFTPARYMTDILRRDILVSPTSPTRQTFDMEMSPLEFDTESSKSSV